MNIFLSLLFSFLFSISDSDSIKLKTNYFDNLKLNNLNLNVEDIFPKSSLKEYAGDFDYLSSSEIDSIKEAAKYFNPSPVASNDTIIIETTKGTIKIEYFPDIAIDHCSNFKKLANSGFYDMTTFHRVLENFMIQGGDILSRDNDRKNDGQGGPGWKVNAEFSNLKHKRGTLSMARGTSPNSAGSQFFICQRDSYHLDANNRWDSWEEYIDINGNNKYDIGEPFTDQSIYTIFGKVVENIHVIDLIANTPTDYTVAKLQCYNKIPTGEDINNWITLKDPKTRKSIYSKVPEGKNKTQHMEKLMSNLRSDNPTAPVFIKKIRVIDGDNLKK